MKRFTSFNFSFPIVTGNMSIAKRTSAEIAKTLTEVYRMRRVNHLIRNCDMQHAKIKLMRKKKKQVMVLVCKVLPQNKDDQAGELRSLRILSPSSLYYVRAGICLKLMMSLSSNEGG